MPRATSSASSERSIEPGCVQGTRPIPTTFWLDRMLPDHDILQSSGVRGNRLDDFGVGFC
jgi:hypothetical protein